MLDSGAEISIGDYNNFFKHLHHSEFKRIDLPTGFAVEGAEAGSRMKIVGLFIVQFMVKDLGTIQWKLLVVKNLASDVILGQDFLAHFGAEIKFKTNRVTWEKQETANVAGATGLSQDGNLLAEREKVPEVKKPVERVMVMEHKMENVQKSVEPESSTASERETESLYSNGNLLTVPLEIGKGFKLPPLCVMKKSVRVQSGVEGKCGMVSSQVAIECLQKVKNCSVLCVFQNETAEEIEFFPGDIIGDLEIVNEELFNIKTVTQISTIKTSGVHEKIDQRKFEMIKNAVNAEHIPKESRNSLYKLLLDFHDIISVDKFDLGFCDLIPAGVTMRETENPIFVPQPTVPLAHQPIVLMHIEELLKKGCLERSFSPWNFPYYLVPKPDGSKRFILDYRLLNEQTLDVKFQFQGVQECLDSIGFRGSKLFTSLDLRSAYWQQALDVESRPKTSFTVPGTEYGKLQWKVLPMGLKQSSAWFGHLMQTVMQGIDGTCVYLDDILIHGITWESHIKELHQVLTRLRQYNLKLNLQKSVFGKLKTTYLGYVVSGDGVEISASKIDAIQKFPTPNSKKKIKSFVGITNYFRRLIPGFARLAAQLTKLTTKEVGWEGGALPKESAEAFEELKRRLTSRPVLAFPNKNQEFILRTDAAVGSVAEPGGMGAVLMQYNKLYKCQQAIAFASRALKSYERNYSATNLEMAAASWAIDYFHVYLADTRFSLIVDAKPVIAQTKQAKKTLSRLQEQLGLYNFDLMYASGPSNTVADSLSRNVQGAQEDERFPQVAQISGEKTVKELQSEDQMCKWFVAYLTQGKLPMEKTKARMVTFNARFCFIHEGLLCINITRKNEESKSVPVIPETLQTQLLKNAHDHKLSGHMGIAKTWDRLIKFAWWPTISKDCTAYVTSCDRCQEAKDPPKFQQRCQPLKSFPVPDGPGEEIFIDLFGPLPQSERGNVHILVVIDSFSKFTTLIPLPDKSAETTARLFYEHYIAIFGPPKRCIHDGAMEFCSKLTRQLNHQMGITDVTSPAVSPETNAQVETFMKNIKKYIKSYIESHSGRGSWEGNLPSCQLAYNSALHRNLASTPMSIHFTRETYMPWLEAADLKPLYNPDDYAKERINSLIHARELAKKHLEEEKQKSKLHYDVHSKVVSYKKDEKVYIFYPHVQTDSEMSQKFARRWFKATVEQVLGQQTYVVSLENNKKSFVCDARRMKKAFVRDNREKEAKKCDKLIETESAEDFDCVESTKTLETPANAPDTSPSSSTKNKETQLPRRSPRFSSKT